MNYHPKNLFKAVNFFIFGVLLSWWWLDKISIFLGLFTTNYPRILIWVAFISISVTWSILIPFMLVTGKSINPHGLFKSMKWFAVGLIFLIAGLPMLNAIIPALESLTNLTGISYFTWIIATALGIYLSVLKPVTCILEQNA